LFLVWLKISIINIDERAGGSVPGAKCYEQVTNKMSAMKTRLASPSNPLSATLTAGVALILLALPSGNLHAGTSLQVGVAPPGSANESNRTAFLTWTAAAGNNYLVQSSTNLGNPSAWTTEDVVSQGAVGPLKWMAPEALEPRKYYRLVLPQPRIFAVEPAIVAPGTPVNFYVVGQMLPTNGVMQINGVPQSNAVVVTSSLVTIPGVTLAAAGNYQVSLVIGGVAVSSFTVVCADPLANPERVLQGPPDEPPASPSARWLSKKGYDDYKAQSDYSFDVEQTLGIGSQASESGGTSRGKDMTGHVTLIRGTGSHGGGGPLATLLMPALLKAKEKADQIWQPGIPDPGGPMVALLQDLSGYNFDVEQTLGIGSQASESGGTSRGKDMTGHVTLIRGTGSHGGGGPLATLLMPALLKAKEKANQTKCGVSLFSGEVQGQATDLAIPGRGLDFVWARTYHSRLGRFGSTTNGWTFSYDVRCVQNSTGGLDVYDGTGRKDTFTPGTNGLYTCPEIFREGALSNNTFTLTFADTGRWVFNPFDGTAAAGKLIQIITRNGDTMTLGYDTSGRLVQVVDDLGRTNTLSYNPSSQLASVTDCSGRSVTYQYYSGAKSDNGSAGDLAAVTSPPVTGTPNGNDFPSGKTTAYTYSKSFPLDRENHLLLTVTNPDGQTAAVFTYEHSSTSANYLRCTAAQEGTNTASCFTYLAFTGTPQGPVPPANWCIVNDPVGNVAQYYFDARNRCLIEDDYTGRATPGLPVTATVNRPTGQLRSSDPAYYEATWSWNNDSLCTSETSPAGQLMQYVYQSDFEPATTARKRADCRVVREIASSAVDLNGDGIPDVTARACYYTYDPRFGSDPMASRGWDGTIKGKAIGTKGTGSIFRQAGGDHAPNMIGNHKDLMMAATSAGVGSIQGRAISTKGTGSIFRQAGGDHAGNMIGNHKDSVLSVASEWDGSIKGKAIGTKGTGSIFRGWDGSLKGLAIGDVDADGTLDFCTSVTDPRGNVTTASYDAEGNCLLVEAATPVVSGGGFKIIYFAYDPHGQLIAVTNAPDAKGRSRVDTFSWSQGQITNCVVDAGGLALSSALQYDARGNVTNYIDPCTNVWQLTYNALDQCVKIGKVLTGGGGSDPVDFSAQYAYDADDNLVQCSTAVLDATGNLLGNRSDNYQYDGEDRLSQVALAVDASHALTNRYAYDGNDECVQVLGGDAVSGADPHQTAAYQYDERGLLYGQSFAFGSPAQSTDQFSYTLNGQLAAANRGVEQPGSSYTYAYDGFDRLNSIRDPMGNQTVCFYDANDNLKVVRRFGELNDVPGSAGNVRLAESDYQYDGLDRCVSAQDLFFNPATQAAIGGGQSLTTCAYAPNDECVSATDTLGHVTTYGYDTACRSVSVTDALGNQQSMIYDADGNALVEMSSELPAAGGKAQVLTVTNVYDGLNRCISRTDSAGNKSSYTYDSLGRCVQTIDPRGIYAFYSYDLRDRCTLAVGDLNGDGVPDFTSDITTTFSWSSTCDNLLAMTDSNTNTTSYAYDSLGRCLAVTHADGTQEQMSWDPRSNLIWEQDPNGTTLTNTYDFCDRMVHRDIAARNVLATTTFETFTYDGCGRLTGAANDSGTNAFTYDSLDDCVSESLNGLTTTSTYDAFGNRLALTYPGGRALTYTYDALNRCASITDSGVQLASYAYDGPGRLSQITYGNGTKTQIAYDGFAGKANTKGDYGFGQISRVRHGIVASGVVIDDRTFSYDPDQNKILRDVTAPFTIGGVAQAMSFQYDNAGRLVDALVTTNGALARLTTYGLDRMGNRTDVTGAASCSGDYSLSSAIPPGDFQMNRYTTTPCDSRAYDGAGDLVGVSSAAGPLTYQYDYAGRLVEVLSSSTGTLAPVASYAYDAVGRRAHKTVYASGLPPATTQFLYDGSRVIEERTGSSTTATYVCADGVQDGNETDLDCGGACLSMNRGGQNYYLHTDDQGNVLALSGGTGGVVERYDYDDYGAVTFLTGDGYPSSATSSIVGNPYGWGGLRLDAETGLQNDDGGGYFEPQTGRYTLRGGVPLKFETGAESAIRGKVKIIRIETTGLIHNNPWSRNRPPLPVAAASGEGEKVYVGHVTLLK